MTRRAVWLALWSVPAIAALLAAAYYLIHRPGAPDGADLLTVALSEEDPSLSRVGGLAFMGGIDIPRSGQNIGGLSALRWDDANERLLALTDDARWVWMEPAETGGRLTGIDGFEVGDLRGLNGETLSGKEAGDSESLTRSLYGGWLVGFERDHRIWRYASLAGRPDSEPFDPDERPLNPEELLGPFEDNNGVEVLAGNEMVLIACAERSGSELRPNCVTASQEGKRKGFVAEPPQELAGLGSVPTDADASMDGTLYILFRSYSPAAGNTAAIVALAADGSRRELAILRAPLTVDNFEGLAVREEGTRTFLYIVSDDNFSGAQRTLLTKFEVLSPPPSPPRQLTAPAR